MHWCQTKKKGGGKIYPSLGSTSMSCKKLIEVPEISDRHFEGFVGELPNPIPLVPVGQGNYKLMHYRALAPHTSTEGAR